MTNLAVSFSPIRFVSEFAGSAMSVCDESMTLNDTLSDVYITYSIIMYRPTFGNLGWYTFYICGNCGYCLIYHIEGLGAA